jgi:hypothetical protein
MKKLMIAATAALCATVSFAELASANVVGYTASNLPNGFSAAAPTFVNTGAEVLNIQDIVALNADGETEGGGVFQLQTKAPSGGLDEQFAYFFDDDIGEDLGDGWYNGDGETLATKDFKPGEGFVFNAAVTGGKIQFAGEVYTKPLNITLPNGFCALGNARPVAVSIQNIIPVNADGETVGGGVFQLQTKTPSGGLDEQFAYFFDDDIGEDLGDGWYNGDGETLATKVFEPGEGFIFNSGITGGFLKFAGLNLQ